MRKYLGYISTIDDVLQIATVYLYYSIYSIQYIANIFAFQYIGNNKPFLLRHGTAGHKSDSNQYGQSSTCRGVDRQREDQRNPFSLSVEPVEAAAAHDSNLKSSTLLKSPWVSRVPIGSGDFSLNRVMYRYAGYDPCWFQTINQPWCARRIGFHQSIHFQNNTVFRKCARLTIISQRKTVNYIIINHD